MIALREAECCALADTDCRPTALRRRASRPQLKRDPLGSSHTTMGVTIHFEGKLKDHASLEAVVRAADAFARARSWRVEPISEMEAHLARVRDEQDWDYAGPTSGIEILPHERCDPLRLEFDEDLYVQEYTKTQFAGPGVHTEVIALLRELAPHFEALHVDDEGEYWDTSDAELLTKHIDTCNRVLADELRKHPGAQGPVQIAAGRWVDIIS